MSVLKKNVKNNKDRSVIDLENILLQPLMKGPWRLIVLKPLFACELCVVLLFLIDGHGCFIKCNKSDFVKLLSVIEVLPPIADIVIVDVSQLFYHIVWPIGGSSSDLIASKHGCLYCYPE